MKKIKLIVIFASMWAQGVAQNWQPVSSSIGFNLKMLGVTVEGKFKGLSATIKFDPANLATSSVVATVDAATIDTDNSLRNRHLREKEDFFEVAKYPKITMKSTKIEKSGNSYVGYFDLTIKKVTKNIKVPFTFIETAEKGVFSGIVTVNRRDWALGGGTLGMANEVTINLVVNTVSK
jgi:polyisoprenoid-binding protein YceI